MATNTSILNSPDTQVVQVVDCAGQACVPTTSLVQSFLASLGVYFRENLPTVVPTVFSTLLRSIVSISHQPVYDHTARVRQYEQNLISRWNPATDSPSSLWNHSTVQHQTTTLTATPASTGAFMTTPPPGVGLNDAFAVIQVFRLDDLVTGLQLSVQDNSGTVDPSALSSVQYRFADDDCKTVVVAYILHGTRATLYDSTTGTAGWAFDPLTSAGTDLEVFASVSGVASSAVEIDTYVVPLTAGFASALDGADVQITL